MSIKRYAIKTTITTKILDNLNQRKVVLELIDEDYAKYLRDLLNDNKTTVADLKVQTGTDTGYFAYLKTKRPIHTCYPSI